MLKNKLNICFASLIVILYACSTFKLTNSKKYKLINISIEELKRKKILRDIDIKDTILVSFKNLDKKLDQYFLSPNGLQQITKLKNQQSFIKKRPILTLYYCKWTFDGERYFTNVGTQKYTSNWNGKKLNFDYDNTDFGYLEIENNSILKLVHIHSN